MKIHDFGVGVSGLYAVLMPYLCPTYALQHRSDFVFLRPWAFLARQDAPGPQNDIKMTPKSLQNDFQNHNNHIQLLTIDVQK